MIICNGIEKSGLHALSKSVQLLGIPSNSFAPDAPNSVAFDHIPYGTLDPKYTKHIYIRRHPRNMLISWVRFIALPVTTGTLIGAMQGFVEGSFHDYCSKFIPWLNEPGVLQVRFEDLFTDGGVTMQKIADYLGVPLDPDAYPNIPGFTQTWTGKLSDWTTVWNAELETALTQYRCNEIQTAFGY